MSKLVNIITVGPTYSGRNPRLTPATMQGMAALLHHHPLHAGATVHTGTGNRHDDMLEALNLDELHVPVVRNAICGDADYLVEEDPGTKICRTILRRQDNNHEEVATPVGLAQYFYYGVGHRDLVILDAEKLCLLSRAAKMLAMRAHTYEICYTGEQPRLVPTGSPPGANLATLHVFTD